MAEKTPTHIGGYQIQKKLGEGAFGRVYQAYDVNVNRLVAIKVLLLSDREVVTRFKNEAIVAGNLRHKNIVTIYEFGEHEGLPFLVMEYLDGENLQEVIRSKKPLTMLQRISIMTQIADGLDCAHRHGVVHRDVKPANMMLLPDGTVKIMDFGIARLTSSQQATRLTQQGNVLGTLLYMAPEQFTPNSEVDALCDIFACGEVYYELLAGRHPFEANEPRVLVYKVTVEDPQPVRNSVPECPPALEDVLARMLSKPRDLRYHSLKEVLFDIQPVLIDLQQERAAALMAEAQELFQRQEAEAANALLPEILELDPGNRTAYRLRDQIQRSLLKPKITTFLQTGRDELAKRRFYEAIQAFTAAARLDAANTEIQDLLAQARTAQEQSQRASQLVSEARQAFDQQNLSGAYKSASEALLLDPENPQASRLLLVIQSAIDRKRQQQALEEALLKAEHLLMIQAYDRALEALAGLGPAEPRVEELAARIRAQKFEHERSARLQAEMAAATEMIREQRLEDAVSHLTDLCTEFSDRPDVRHLLEYARKELVAHERAQAVEQIKAEAQRRADANDFRGALEVLDKGLPKYDDSSLVRLLGEIMARKAAWEREEAIKAARARSERLRAEGKLTDAIQAVESAIRTHNPDPGMVELLRSLERDWEQAKRGEEIRVALVQARKALDAGQPEKALRTLSDAARRFPDSAEVQALLAEAQDAFQAQARQRELESLAAEVRAHVDRNNHDAALQVLDRGLEKYPAEAVLTALRQDVTQKRVALLRRQDVQRAVQDGNRLAAEGRYAEALDLVADALRRFDGEAALVELQRKLQIDWERRRRAQAIAEAGSQGRALLEQGRPAEAVELLRAACERYPEARDLQSLLARAQRAAATEQFAREVRALLDGREYETAQQRIEQGLRTWPGERSLAGMQAEAVAGAAVERCRLLVAQGRPADAVRTADAALREFPGEAGLLEARQQAQAGLEEAERVRRRAADLEALGRLENESRALADAAQIGVLADRVRGLAKPYAGDQEFEAAAGRTLQALAGMEQAGALLAGRDFAALQIACMRLRSEYPGHVFFQRLEAEAARGVRQLALQEIRRKVQGEPDLRARGHLLDEALRVYPDEAWLQQEARVIRGRLGLVDSIVEKAKTAEEAGRWDEAIEEWNSLRGLMPNYPGLDRQLEGLAARKQQARAETRLRRLAQVRDHMEAGAYDAAASALQQAGREFPGDPELQAAREQVDFVQRAVQEAGAAAGKQSMRQAARILEAALGRYAGDQVLQQAAQAVARQAAEREAGITDVLRQAEEMAAGGRLDEACREVEGAAARFGEDQRLQDLLRRLQSLREAVRQARALAAQQKFPQAAKLLETELGRYPADPVLERELETIRDSARQVQLEAARRLEEDTRALTASAQIPGLAQRLRAIAGPFANDAEIGPICAGIQQRIDAMQQAGVLLARREYAAAIEICSRYPDQRLLQNLKAEAERGERAARLAEAERQVDAEPDLRRQADLLDVTIRFFPDEAALLERSRVAHGRLDQIESTVRKARQAEEEERWDEAIAQWNSVRELYRDYAGVDQEIARIEERKRQALGAERERQAERIWQQIDGGDYDRAATLLQQALQAFPGDAGLQDLSGQVQVVRQTVQQARNLAMQGKLPQAAETIETAQKTYPDDKLLARELESVRQEAARQAEERAADIRRAAHQIEGLTAQGKLDDALKLARTAVQRYPGEASLLTAQESARAVRQRNAALEALRDLDAEARALSSASGIAGIESKAQSVAAPYTDDQQIAQAAADLRQQLAAMAQAQAQLDQHDFAAALAACDAYPGHRYFARVRTDAERGERAARVAEVQQQVEQEPDLMRQIELLDATIRFYPNEASLLEQSRLAHSRLREVEAVARRASQAEKAERLDEALAQWEAVGRLYKDYPGLAQEIERINGLKERARGARREQAGDAIWQRINAGDHDAAVQLLEQALAEFPGDAELHFLREQVEIVRQSVREARDLAGKGQFGEAIRVLEVALARNAGDVLLQRALDEIGRQAELQREIRDAVARVRKLAREGNQQAIVQMVRDCPPQVQQDPEIQEVLAAAESIELTAQARALAQQAQFADALKLLDDAARRYPAGGQQVAVARAEVAALQTAWQQARAAERAAAQAAQLAAAHEAQRRRELELLTAEVDRLCAKRKFAAALSRIEESGKTAAEVGALRERVESLLTQVETAPQPRPKSKIAWIAAAAAILALAGWGVSVLLHRDGTVIVETAPGATVLVDKSNPTQADEKGLVSLRIAAGHHVVGAAKPGFEGAEQPVEVSSGATNRVTMPLSPSRGVTPTPVISSLDPGSVVNLGAAFKLTVSGSGFKSGATVKWNGGPLRTSYVKATQLRADVPANLVASPGKAVITVVNPVEVTSKPITLPINPSAPAIAGLLPDAVNAGEGFVLHVTGSGFQPGAAVAWGAKRLPSTVESATALRAGVTKDLVATPGTVAVTVINPGDAASSPVTFTIKSLTPTPAISGLHPSLIAAGGADFTLTVTGSNFVQGVVVQWNGAQLTPRAATQTQLQVSVSANLIANPGSARVTVVNPGGVSSPEVNLPIVAAPAITGLNPSAATAGAAVNLTVNGSNFESGATLEWNRSPLAATFVSASQLRAAVAPNLVPAPGAASVVVINPGNVRSAPATFTVNPAPVVVPPVISGLNPSSIEAGGQAFTLTVNGSGFGQNALVHWNRAPLAMVSAGATQLRATVPANLIGNAGTANVTVVNPENVTSGSATVTITPPAAGPPSISGLSPSSAPAGGPAFTLTVNGSGFQPGASVRWEGSSMPTRFVGPGQLTAQIIPNRIIAPGSAAITVVNQGTLPSAPATFTIRENTADRAALAGIQGALERYKAAYAAKNAKLVREVWPNIPPDTLRGLGRLFSIVRSCRVDLKPMGPPEIRGSTAAATYLRTIFEDGRPAPEEKVTIHFQLSGASWVISSID
jgi:serine/threonine protein kinase